MATKWKTFGQTIVSQLNQTTQRVPNNVAHIIGNRKITWSELSEGTENLSTFLQQKYDVQKNDFVWYISPRRAEESQSWLASSTCGAIFVPIHQDFPVNRMSDFYERMPPKCIITEKQYLPMIENFNAPKICLPEKADLWENNVSDLKFESVPDLHADDASIVMYTSGTTGLPKIVKLSHRSLLYVGEYFLGNLLKEEVPEDSTLCFMTLSTGVAAPMMHCWSLAHGGKLVHCDFNPAEFHNHYAKHNITRGLAFGRALLEMKKSGATFDSVEMVTYGGMPVPISLVRSFAPQCPNALGFINLYGLTETAGPCIQHVWQPGQEITESIVPISEGFPGSEIKLGDDNEILLKTPGMLNEYHQNPEATKALIQDGWVHTGDVGIKDKNGYIYVVDRLKDIIVNSDAANIYPIDVESVLMQHPSIDECAVIGVPSSQYEIGEEPFAFLVLNQDEVHKNILTKDEIIDWCKQNLKKTALPHGFHVIDKLPRTRNNKIQKHILKQMFKDLNLSI